MGEKLGDNLFELRSGIGGNIQRALYFHWLGSKFIITHGFTKKTQKTPIQEIAKAIEIRKEFEEGDQRCQQLNSMIFKRKMKDTEFKAEYEAEKRNLLVL